MALIARSREPLAFTDDLLVRIVVDFYDDADPANAGVTSVVPPSVVKHSKTWTVEPQTTSAALVASVVQYGQNAVAAYTAWQALAAAIPQGASAVIPANGH